MNLSIRIALTLCGIALVICPVGFVLTTFGIPAWFLASLLMMQVAGFMTFLLAVFNR